MEQDNFYTRVSKLIKETNKNGVEKKNLKLVIGQANINYNTYYSNQKFGKMRLPKADDAVKIAEILGTSVEYLVTGKHPDFSKEREKFLQNLEIFEKIIQKIKETLKTKK